MVTEKAFQDNKEVEPVEPAQGNIYKSDTFRKDCSWLHFHNDLRVQERPQAKEKQPYISIFIAFIIFSISS